MLSRVWPSATPWTVAHQDPLSMDSPGKNAGVGCHFLLQGVFLTQGLNPGLPHCRQALYQLSHQGAVLLKEIYPQFQTPSFWPMGPVTASNHPEHSQLHRLHWGSLLETLFFFIQILPILPAPSTSSFCKVSVWPTRILFFSEYSESLQSSLNESVNLHCLRDSHVGDCYNYLIFCVFSCFLILDCKLCEDMAPSYQVALQTLEGSRNIQTLGVLLTLSKELDTTEQLSPH